MTFTQKSSSFRSLNESSSAWSALSQHPQGNKDLASNDDVREPVPFDDFKINFGISPDIFATPIPIAIDLALAQPQQQQEPQPSTTCSNTTSFINSFLLQEQPTLFDLAASNTASSSLPFPLPTTTLSISHDLNAASVLDENDQKAFSNFLDTFFIDDMQLHDGYTPTATSTSNGYQDFNSSTNLIHQAVDQEEQEELRRNSILQSLDEQKKLHQKLNLIASLPQFSSSKCHSPASHSATLNDLMINSTHSTESSHPNAVLLAAEKSASQIKTEAKTTATNVDNVPESIFLKRSEYITPPYTSLHSTPPPPHPANQAPLSPTLETASSSTSSILSSAAYSKKKRSSVVINHDLERENEMNSNHRKTKRSRTIYRELLTEEEKRANHIASEQKRRTTIRNGFKDLTELVPTLKNVNNSKSNVLFKAVEFIHHLEERNKSLRQKIRSLELRAQVEGCTASYYKDRQMPSISNTAEEEKALTISVAKSPPHSLQKPEKESQSRKRRKLSSSTISSSSSSSSSTNSLNSIKRTIHASDIYTYPPPQKTIMNSNSLPLLPMNARNALLAHKKQEKQLLLLQEQLQLHQKLIAEREEQKEKSIHRHLAAFKAASAVQCPQHKVPVQIKPESNDC